jgi:3-hydroxyisobutyrate dehydrogenase-like beta-hydroxyacid dehydrogenase
MSVTVAIIAMGEMGAGVARRLTARGARVLTSLDGRSAASAARAAEAGAEAAPDDEALVEGADILLSIVPPARAGDLAGRFLPAIRRTNARPLYVDCNAIAPRTLDAIARPFLEEGLPFADVGIVGGPPTDQGYTPRFYASGDHAGGLERLNDHGLDVRRLPGGLGDASALKMAYAGSTKGTQAVMISIMLGAARAGVAEALAAEMADSQPGRIADQLRHLPATLRKAYRWDGEMEEIARFLDPESGASEIFQGAAELYRRLAADAAAGPGSERLRLLGRYE